MRYPSVGAQPPVVGSAALLASLDLRQASLSMIRSSCVSAKRILGHSLRARALAKWQDDWIVR